MTTPTNPEGGMSALDLAEKIHEIYSWKVTQSSLCEVYNMLEQRDAQLSQAKGEGWVLVPKEPTHEMTASAGVRPTEDRTKIVKIYKAMIAAALQASDEVV